jgi:glycosyltransferase involved in cell wall biosynthesis
MTDSPLLSIIITAYTAERLADIYELLISIKNQTYVNTETIFVVERSKQLLERISSYATENNIPNLKVLFNDGEPGLSAARNVGIKAAKGDIIAFVDDDVLLYPDWAEKMASAHRDDSIIGVTGPAIPLWEDPSMAWFPQEFYWIISCTAWDPEDCVKEVRNAWGMNTTARLTPKLKANLSMSPKFSLRGNKAANMVYPGKNNTTGKPRIIRKTLFGRKVTTIKSTTVRELMR